MAQKVTHNELCHFAVDTAQARVKHANLGFEYATRGLQKEVLERFPKINKKQMTKFANLFVASFNYLK